MKKLGKLLIQNKKNRVRIVACLSLMLNVLFALYHGVIGFLSHSVWLFCMCIYYSMLSIMRLTALLCTRKRSLKMERVVMKSAGCFMIPLSLILAAMIALSQAQSIATKYGEIMMITIATYTFSKIAMAVMRFIKNRGKASTIEWVFQSISAVEVAVSLLTMQRSMLVSFGNMKPTDIRLMNYLTGTAVCIFIFLLGILMMNRNQKGANKMSKSKFVKMNEKVVDTYNKIEDTVVDTYNKVEETVTGAYTKIEDAFVDRYLTREGETVEEAKERLKQNR